MLATMRRFFYISVLLSVLTSLAWAQTTQPSALTTTGGPPVPVKEKGKRKSILSNIPLPSTSGSMSTPSALSGLGLPSGSVESPKNVDQLISETLPDLGLKLKQLRGKRGDKRSKKKQSTTDYEGVAMVKAYNKIGSGDRTVVEEFYILREHQNPSPFLKDTYWFDEKGHRVTNAIPRDGNQRRPLMHGPYKRYQNGNLVEEGYYYVGSKDGRWEKYDQNFQLLDKARWYHGFPADSRIAYYDSAHTKLKEVTPIEFGQINGTYFAFHENGRLAVEGKYDHGVKIGRWTEYYPNGTRQFRKRLMQYARDRWNTEFEPFIISEWDEKGKMIFEQAKEKNVVTEDETDN